MRAVNLLPSGASKREARKPQSKVVLGGVVGVVLVTALLGASFVSKSSDAAQQREQVQLAQADLRSIPAPAPVDAAQPELRQARDARLTAVASALGRRMAWDRVLREFSQVLPSDVWLTTLTAKSPLGAGAATPELPGAKAPETFLLAGHSYSHQSVARLLARLALLPDLANVELRQSLMTTVAGRRIVQFTIVASVRAPRSSA